MLNIPLPLPEARMTVDMMAYHFTQLPTSNGVKGSPFSRNKYESEEEAASDSETDGQEQNFWPSHSERTADSVDSDLHAGEISRKCLHGQDDGLTHNGDKPSLPNMVKSLRPVLLNTVDLHRWSETTFTTGKHRFDAAGIDIGEIPSPISSSVPLSPTSLTSSVSSWESLISAKNISLPCPLSRPDCIDDEDDEDEEVEEIREAVILVAKQVTFTEPPSRPHSIVILAPSPSSVVSVSRPLARPLYLQRSPSHRSTASLGFVREGARKRSQERPRTSHSSEPASELISERSQCVLGDTNQNEDRQLPFTAFGHGHNPQRPRPARIHSPPEYSGQRPWNLAGLAAPGTEVLGYPKPKSPTRPRSFSVTRPWARASEDSPSKYAVSSPPRGIRSNSLRSMSNIHLQPISFRPALVSPIDERSARTTHLQSTLTSSHTRTSSPLRSGISPAQTFNPVPHFSTPTLYRKRSSSVYSAASSSSVTRSQAGPRKWEMSIRPGPVSFSGSSTPRSSTSSDAVQRRQEKRISTQQRPSTSSGESLPGETNVESRTRLQRRRSARRSRRGTIAVPSFPSADVHVAEVEPMPSAVSFMGFKLAMKWVPKKNKRPGSRAYY